MTTVFPEPASTPDLRGLMLDYLDFFRSVVAGKLVGLSPDQVTESVVPSGWTPAGLALHLANVERRWLVWGFLGEQVRRPVAPTRPTVAAGGPRTSHRTTSGRCSTRRRHGRGRSSSPTS